MSRFNATKTAPRPDTTNREGSPAYAKTPRLALASHVLTSMVKNQFYRSVTESVNELKDRIDAVEPKFAAKTAIFARSAYGLRSVSHVVAGEIARLVKGKTWTKNFFDSVVLRPDDMTEILAYYGSTGGDIANPPAAVRKGFARALRRFDAYQLRKYAQPRNAVSLVDVVNIVHPVPTEGIDALVNGTLRAANTWEANMSAAGESDNASEEKADTWREMLEDDSLGHMALVMNLRNIANDAPDAVDLACRRLTDERAIRGSRMLPFRYMRAVRAIQDANVVHGQKIVSALNRAIDVACDNVPDLDGRTAVAFDTSSSMSGEPAYYGSMFAAVLAKTNHPDMMTFASRATWFPYNADDSTTTIAEQLCDRIGGGTNFHNIFSTLNRAYDRVIILTDEQAWGGFSTPEKSFREYRDRHDANPHVYVWDLAGYGTSQFPSDRVYSFGGFSPKAFDIMDVLETDRDALVHAIEDVEL